MTHPQIEPLYVFARWMLGSHEAAFEAMCMAIENAPGEDVMRQLAILVAELTATETTAKVDRFDELDDILRSDSTVPIDLEHPLVRGDARRLEVLLLELQRTCLMTALRNLPAGRRATFILLYVMGLSLETVAAVCQTNVSALRMLEIRGRRALEGYLTTRCEHLDPGNPCHCAPRLGGALERGFVTWPAHNDFAEAGAPEHYSEVKTLYARLPRVRLPVFQPRP